MSAPEDRLALARRRVEEARRRFGVTLGSVRQELEPARLVDGAMGRIRQKADRTAGEALAFVRERPGTLAAVTAGILLFVFRHPIAEAIGHLFGDATASGDAALDAENPPRPATED